MSGVAISSFGNSKVVHVGIDRGTNNKGKKLFQAACGPYNTVEKIERTYNGAKVTCKRCRKMSHLD